MISTLPRISGSLDQELDRFREACTHSGRVMELLKLMEFMVAAPTERQIFEWMVQEWQELSKQIEA